MTLSIRDLTIERDGKIIIEKLAMKMSSRSITLLKGANGSGKSTLLDAIAGVAKPKSGTITLGEKDLLELGFKEAATLRSYLQQRREFTLSYSVREILEMVTRNAVRRSRVRSIKSLAHELDIDHLMDRSVLELSGGERDRVSLAIALLREVELYLLDEPLAAQDLHHSELIAKYLEKIARSGAHLIIATHQSPELAEVADSEITLD
jgi:iron complex transport system ATP-binding protein